MFDWLVQHLQPNPSIEAKLIISLAIFAIFWLTRFFIHQFINRRVDTIETRHNWRKITTYTLMAIVILILGRVWFRDIQGIATFLGLVSAGLAIALSGPLTSLAGWMYIIYKRHIQIGDRIEIDGKAGDIIDISLFQVALLEIGNWVDADQSTGRVLYIPNSKVFSHPLANYTRSFQYIWNEIRITITFESNWQKAKEILGEIATRDAANLSAAAAVDLRRAAQKFAIKYTKLTPIVYLDVVDYGIRLTIRYLCDPRRRRSTEQAIWEDVLVAFDNQPDIEIAYPTQRFYQRHIEMEPTHDF